MWFKSSFTIPAVAAISFCLIGGTVPAPAYADLGDQLFKLVPDDGALGDHFGYSVAISGTIAIVGARLDDDNGEDSGSAYLFDTTTGRQLFKLLANDGAMSDRFGWSVAISGATAVVGAWLDDDNGDQSGSAYLFDITTGRQLFKLLPSDGAQKDSFGFSVAISGATAIVGAFSHDGNRFNSGSAYLFDVTTGKQIAKVLPNDGAKGDIFGISVAISGTTAIVGAKFDDDNGSNAGSAYLFDISDPKHPVQIAKLLASDGAAFDQFGFSVGISGATAIVGAVSDDDNGLSSGSAYLFDTTTGKQLLKLLPNDGAAVHHFGLSVEISGPPGNQIAIVGAPNGHDFFGSAYLFDTTTGQQIAKLLADDGAAGDQFGFSVAISSTIAIVGARGDDNDNGSASGSAYFFDAAACAWDLDASGDVGVKDLLILLGAWGPCPKKGDCPADFDDSGDVGVKDLLVLLGNWGPCP